MSSTPEQQRDQLFEGLTRRRLLVTGGATAATLGLGPKLAAFAQESTPVADEEQSAVEAEGGEGATPTADLPAVPPEFDVETNWPVEGGDLKAHRVARGSGINSEVVGELGLAWSVPINVSAFFGALTANPVVVGDVVYLQDAAANVYAFTKEPGESGIRAPP